MLLEPSLVTTSEQSNGNHEEARNTGIEGDEGRHVIEQSWTREMGRQTDESLEGDQTDRETGIQ